MNAKSKEEKAYPKKFSKARCPPENLRVTTLPDIVTMVKKYYNKVKVVVQIEVVLQGEDCGK